MPLSWLSSYSVFVIPWSHNTKLHNTKHYYNSMVIHAHITKTPYKLNHLKMIQKCYDMHIFVMHIVLFIIVFYRSFLCNNERKSVRRVLDGQKLFVFFFQKRTVAVGNFESFLFWSLLNSSLWMFLGVAVPRCSSK